MISQGLHRAIIFDFDGVIADSEVLANVVLAEKISALGFPVTLEQVLQRYQGKRWSEFAIALEEVIGKYVPPDFKTEWEGTTLDRLRSELQEVQGATAFIRKWAAIPKCIASSSSIARLSISLKKLNLEEDFGSNVLSADSVSRGKPFPDIFLLAADKLGVAPASCVVIEDSGSGVRAAIDAGMTVIGLIAASHVRDGHRQRLIEAGARHLAANWSEVDDLMPSLFGPSALSVTASAQLNTTT
jgi:HAD superfamily hydrolase (TIGR01509 family)